MKLCAFISLCDAESFTNLSENIGDTSEGRIQCNEGLIISKVSPSIKTVSK